MNNGQNIVSFQKLGSSFLQPIITFVGSDIITNDRGKIKRLTDNGIEEEDKNIYNNQTEYTENQNNENKYYQNNNSKTQNNFNKQQRHINNKINTTLLQQEIKDKDRYSKMYNEQTYYQTNKNYKSKYHKNSGATQNHFNKRAKPINNKMKTNLNLYQNQEGYLHYPMQYFK